MPEECRDINLSPVVKIAHKAEKLCILLKTLHNGKETYKQETKCTNH